MQKWIAVVLAGLAVSMVRLEVAHAERPTTGYVLPTERPAAGARDARRIGAGTIIFFNRKGGTYAYGEPDSRTNTNNIAPGTLAPFECGDAKWAQVMECLKDSFLPYNVKVTDADPGNVEHVETVVAGGPGDLGLDPNVGGIAPLGCDLAYDNPVTFAFSQPWSCDVNQICWAAAQETAHAFGLDHSTECSDHMTYDQDCSPVKRFRDVDKPCGEDEDLPPNQQPPNASGPRRCICTNKSTQNSHRDLLAIFGSRENGAPSVDFVHPHEGSVVTKGFTIELAIDDDFGLASVDILVDGAHLDSKTAAPFMTVTPATLTDGPHTLTARATDQGGLVTETEIHVKVQPPCDSIDDCPAPTAVCQAGECIDGPGTPGGLGAECGDASECQSGNCAAGPGGQRCVEACQVGASSCPDGFDCLSAGNEGACWPGADVLTPPDTGGCGCHVGNAERRAPLVAFVMGFTFFGFALSRRRR